MVKQTVPCVRENSDTKLCLDAQVSKERDHAETLFKKRYCVLAQTRRHYTCHLLPLDKVSIWTELLTQDIARLKLTLSHTRNCPYYRLTARMFSIRTSAISRVYRWLQPLQLLMEIPLQVTSLWNTLKLPLSRPKLLGKTYLCHDVRYWRVVTTNSTPKRNADVHRFVLTT